MLELEQRVKSRKAGKLESWNVGILEYWNDGKLECWNYGMVESWNGGMMVTSEPLNLSTSLQRQLRPLGYSGVYRITLLFR